MEITQQQKEKMFEELLMDEELHDESSNNWERDHWGSVSSGVRRVIKILGLYEEYKIYKEDKHNKGGL